MLWNESETERSIQRTAKEGRDRVSQKQEAVRGKGFQVRTESVMQSVHRFQAGHYQGIGGIEDRGDQQD